MSSVNSDLSTGGVVSVVDMSASLMFRGILASARCICDGGKPHSSATKTSSSVMYHQSLRLISVANTESLRTDPSR